MPFCQRDFTDGHVNECLRVISTFIYVCVCLNENEKMRENKVERMQRR